ESLRLARRSLEYRFNARDNVRCHQVSLVGTYRGTGNDYGVAVFEIARADLRQPVQHLREIAVGCAAHSSGSAAGALTLSAAPVAASSTRSFAGLSALRRTASCVAFSARAALPCILRHLEIGIKTARESVRHDLWQFANR